MERNERRERRVREGGKMEREGRYTRNERGDGVRRKGRNVTQVRQVRMTGV